MPISSILNFLLEYQVYLTDPDYCRRGLLRCWGRLLDRPYPARLRVHRYLLMNFDFHVVAELKKVYVKRRSGTEQNKGIDAALESDYDFQLGETGAQAQLRVFHFICEHLRMIREQHVDMLELYADDPSHSILTQRIFADPDVLRVTQMVGANMIRVKIKPNFRTMIPLGVPSDPVEQFFGFIDEWAVPRGFHDWGGCTCIADCSDECVTEKKAYESYDNPHYWAKKAFVSGQNLEGLEVAMKNLFKNRRNPRVPSAHVVAAFAQIFSKVDDLQLMAPSFSEADIDNARSRDETKSSGYMNYMPHPPKPYYDPDLEMDRMTDRLVNFATQADYFSLAKMDLLALAKKVHGNVVSGVYSRDWFPVCLAKIALKPEIRDPTVSRSKVRVFFIMSYLKLLVDKILYRDIFPNFYGKGMCGIGHVWAQGGAESIARDLDAYNESVGFFETDFQNLDQTLLPGMLTLLFSLPMIFFDPSSKYYSSVSAFMTWSADDIACTLVKWLGPNCRLIIGVMFSGLYGTSWGDSIYVEVSITCLFFFLVSEFKDAGRDDLAEMLNNSPRAGRVYGDNTLLSLPKPVLQFATAQIDREGTVWPFGLIQFYFSAYWGLTLKLSETFVHVGPGAFWTEISTKRNMFGDAVSTRITKRGPQYLKRFFIKNRTKSGIEYAMPFRETRDYFVKSVITNKDVRDPRIWLSRWVGLLIDTAGTNTTAWSYLCFLINGFLDHECDNDDDWIDWINSTTRLDYSELIRRSRKMGITNDGEITCPTRNELYRKFLPPGLDGGATDYY